MTRALAPLAALALAAMEPSLAFAPGGTATEGATAAPTGLVLSAALGGGGALGAGTQYTPSGVFELELSAGYDLGYGLRPELAAGLGVAPGSYVLLRPGLHYDLPDMPFYARAALDWSTVRGIGRWRWALLGGGGEIRITDVLGVFAGAEVGIPLHADTGLGVLVRAGVTFRP